MNRNQLNRTNRRFESLEKRELLSVTASPDAASTRTLAVRGDAAAETANITVSNGQIGVSGTGLALKSFPLSSFDVINIGLQGGDDTIAVTIDPVLAGSTNASRLANLRVNAWGGDGNDRITMNIKAEAVDKVMADGGSGSDTLALNGILPRSLTTTSIESRQYGALAQGQQQLRQTGLPSMFNQLTSIPLTNSYGNRSAQVLANVIDQFDVGYSFANRYRPSTQYPDTRCNIFAGDVAKAMSVFLPSKEYLGGAAGDKMTAGAAALNSWLSTPDAGSKGWFAVDPKTASGMQTLLSYARAGYMVVASSPDHIAVVRPDQPASMSATSYSDLLIAQAGARNFSYGTVSYGFSGSLPNAKFYINMR